MLPIVQPCVSLSRCLHLTISTFYLSLSCSLLHSFPTRRSSDLSFRFAQIRPAPFSESALFRVRLWKAFLRNGPWRPDHARRDRKNTSELQSPMYLVCRLLLEKKNIITYS